MTLSPVSLAELRSFLNLGDSDSHDDDEELWTALLSAVDIVEARVGAIRPRTQTSRVYSDGCSILLPIQPVLSVEQILDYNGVAVDPVSVYLNADAGRIEPLPYGSYLARYPYYPYTVDYTVGRDPVPQSLMDAVKIVGKLQWDTQRGPSAIGRFTAIGSDSSGQPTGLDWYRAQQLMAPHRQFSVA